MEKQGQLGLLWNSHPQASGVWQACKKIFKKKRTKREEDREEEESQPEHRGDEEEREKQRKDKHSGPASHISVRGSYKHPARLRITEHRPNKT